MLSVAVIGVIVAVTVSIVLPQATVTAGIFVLVGAVAGWFRVSRPQRIVSIVLFSVGLSALIGALALGAHLEVGQLFSVNQNIIAMLAAVTFIQLIAPDAARVQPSASGIGAVWRTAGALQLLGAVINISAVNIVADHLSRRAPLRVRDALLVSRSFSPGAFWSPFWGAAAAAITYAPSANVSVLVVSGLALAAVAMGYGVGSLVRRFRAEFVSYEGYPLTARALRIPIVLTIILVGVHSRWPDAPVPAIVTASSLGITIVVLFAMRPRSIGRELAGHVAEVLPRNRGEITLFASAGVLAVGLAALVDATNLTLPIGGFGVISAWLAAIAMSGMSLIGVHPIISIGTLAALLAPVGPDPTLFAFASMIAWGSSAAVGPISGLNVYLSGRYGVSGFAITRKNIPYLGVVLIAALPALYLASALTGNP